MWKKKMVINFWYVCVACETWSLLNEKCEHYFFKAHFSIFNILKGNMEEKWSDLDDSEMLALVAQSENTNVFLHEHNKQNGWSSPPHPEI